MTRPNTIDLVSILRHDLRTNEAAIRYCDRIIAMRGEYEQDYRAAREILIGYQKAIRADKWEGEIDRPMTA